MCAAAMESASIPELTDTYAAKSRQTVDWDLVWDRAGRTKRKFAGMTAHERREHEREGAAATAAAQQSHGGKAGKKPRA